MNKLRCLGKVVLVGLVGVWPLRAQELIPIARELTDGCERLPADCPVDLDSIRILPEPRVTRGLTNVVFFDYAGLDPGLIPRERLRVALALVNVSGASLANCQLRVIEKEKAYEAHIRPELFDRVDNTHPFQDGVEYHYTAWVLAVEQDSTLHCSPVSGVQSSVQDASPPAVEVDSIDPCTPSPEVRLRFRACDLVSGSVDSARLYIRRESGQSWTQVAVLDLDEKVPAICGAPVEAEFQYRVPENGYYEFFVAAKDTARAPDADPLSPLSGRDGNWSVPTPDSAADASVFVDALVPEVVEIVPGEGAFRKAAQVDSIKIVFNRKVRPVKSWSESVTLVNAYANDERVAFTAIPSDTAAVEALICKLDSLSTAGWFVVSVTDFVSADARCPLPGGTLFTSDFFTYMEAGQGGTIRTAALNLTVPSGAPSEDLVFKFEPVGRDAVGPCEYKNARSLALPAQVVAPYRQPEEMANVAVPGTLALSYADAGNGFDPNALRLFRQFSEGCKPAGDRNSWQVDTGDRKVFTAMEDLNGVFFIAAVQVPAGAEQILGNYPNPFGVDGDGVTTITYILQRPNAAVSLRIYDAFGNLVRTFDPSQLTTKAGLNECTWDGTNDVGEKVGNGGYIAVLNVDGQRFRRKIGVVW